MVDLARRIGAAVNEFRRMVSDVSKVVENEQRIIRDFS